MLYTKYAWSVFLHLSLTILAVHSVEDWPHTGTQHRLCRGKVVTVEASVPCMGVPACRCDLLELRWSLGWPGWDQACNWNSGNVLLERRCFPKKLSFPPAPLIFLTFGAHGAGLKAKEGLLKGCRFGSLLGSISRVGCTACKTAQPPCHCRQWFTAKILGSNF